MPDPTENGHTEGDEGPTLAERAAQAAGLNDPIEELDSLFPDGFVDGDEWALERVRKSKLPIEVTVSLSKAEVPLRGGLPDPNKVGRLSVRTGGGKFEVVPVFEDEEIISWKIRAHRRAMYVEPMGDPEEVITLEFERLMLTNRQSAAELADRLVRNASGVSA